MTLATLERQLMTEPNVPERREIESLYMYLTDPVGFQDWLTELYRYAGEENRAGVSGQMNVWREFFEREFTPEEAWDAWR